MTRGCVPTEQHTQAATPRRAATRHPKGNNRIRLRWRTRQQARVRTSRCGPEHLRQGNPDVD